MLAALAFPLLAAWAVEAFGLRAASAVVLALGLASLWLARAGSLRAVPLALPALALATGDERWLRLVPAVIELALAGLFLASLRGSGSILQQAALWLEPYAPDFIGSYCRKATLAFAALFALQALALAWLAFTDVADRSWGWAWTSSLLVWLPTLAATAVEFLVRKAWFRNYGGAPWDRVLRALLPPENTEQGRRSLAWIREKREELGMPPP
jgi:uncharacterized membrane protein